MGRGDIVKEKKKQKNKKNTNTNTSVFSAPVFVMPEVVKKKQKWG